MSVGFLLIRQGIEMRLDHEIYGARGRVREEVLQGCSVHGEVSLYCCESVEWW